MYERRALLALARDQDSIYVVDAFFFKTKIITNFLASPPTSKLHLLYLKFTTLNTNPEIKILISEKKKIGFKEIECGIQILESEV